MGWYKGLNPPLSISLSPLCSRIGLYTIFQYKIQSRLSSSKVAFESFKCAYLKVIKIFATRTTNFEHEESFSKFTCYKIEHNLHESNKCALVMLHATTPLTNYLKFFWKGYIFMRFYKSFVSVF